MIFFNPIEHRLTRNIMLGSDDGLTLTQRNINPPRSIVWRFFYKIYDRIGRRNEQIARISATFNEIINNNPKNLTNHELVNLYNNCKYFNDRIIHKHNTHWLSFLPCWTPISGVNQGGIAAIQQLFIERVNVCKKELTESDGVKNKIAQFKKAIEMRQSALAIDDPSIKDGIEKAIAEVYTKEAKRLSETQQLEAEDLNYIEELDQLTQASLEGKNIITELKERRSTKFKLYQRYRERVNDENNTSLQHVDFDFERSRQFITSAEQKALKKDYGRHIWYCKTYKLHQKMLNAKTKEISNLDADLMQLAFEVTLNDGKNAKYLNAARGVLQELEKMSDYLKQWKGLQNRAVLTKEMKALYQETLVTAAGFPDAKSDHHVARVKKEVVEILDNINKRAVDYNKWENHFATQTRLIYEHEITQLMLLREYVTPQEFTAFMSTLPDSEDKKALDQMAKDFEALVVDGKIFIKAVGELACFKTRFYNLNYVPTSKDGQDLKQIESLYVSGKFLPLFESQLKEIKLRFTPEGQ